MSQPAEGGIADWDCGGGVVVAARRAPRGRGKSCTQAEFYTNTFLLFFFQGLISKTEVATLKIIISRRAQRTAFKEEFVFRTPIIHPASPTGLDSFGHSL